MSILPRAYRRDAGRIAERAEELLAVDKDHPQMLAKTKKLNLALADFVARWEKEPNVASNHTALQKFREQQQKVAWRIENLYVITLQELLEAKRDWITSELFLNAAKVYSDLVKHTPEHLRGELLKIHEETMSCPYDAAEDYRETMNDADEREAAFRRLAQELDDPMARTRGRPHDCPHPRRHA